MPPRKQINIDVQEFDGNPSMVKFFFDQLKEIKDIYQLSNREIIALFKSKLQGAALHFYLESPVFSQIDNLEQLQTEFLNFYVPVKDSCASIQKLEALKLDSQESLRNFAYRLDRAVKTAYPGLDQTALLSIKFTHFIHALPKTIKVKILEENITDFQLALKRAENLKIIYDNNNSPPQRNTQDFVCYQAPTSETYRYNDKNYHPYKMNDKDWRNKKHHNQYFEKYSHQSRYNSGQKRGNYKQKFYNTRNYQNPSTNVQCQFCGKYKHLLKNCPEFRDFMKTCTQNRTNEQVVQNPQNNESNTADSQHQIFSAYDNKHILPCIMVNIQKIEVNALVDSGSSLSLMDEEFFRVIKGNVIYKFLSRKVKIKTINSTVQFSGCVQISFKIGKFFMSHNFYITPIQHDDFHVILGYDFLEKNSISIIPSFNSLLIKDIHIPFVKLDNNSHHTQTGNSIQTECLLENNDVQILGSQDTGVDLQQVYCQQIDISGDKECHIPITNDIIQSNVNDNNNIEVNDVVNTQKIMCPENSMIYVRVNYKFKPKENFIFIPTFQKQNLIVHESLHSLSAIQNDLFLVVIQNTCDVPIHVNKNTILGYIDNIDDNDDVEKYAFEQEDNTHFCNIITPSPDIINQRIQDLTCDDFKLQHLTEEQKNHLLSLLMNKAQAFSKNLKTLGHTDLVCPKVDVLNNMPIRALPFPVPQALQSEALNQLNQMMDAGIITRSNSSWACPMLLIKKKRLDITKPQAYRLALDLRLLNAIIIPSSYPLPKIQNLLTLLSKHKFFCTLDLPSAYWQIALPEDIQEKISFTTPWGCFTYKRLVFGLRTAASTFQQLIDTLIQQANIDSCYAYQDDIVLGANTFEEMCQKLNTLLNVFINNNVTLNPEKCTFFQTQIDFLGFHIEEHKVLPISSNITKITAFPIPKTKRQLKAFIGLCSFYRSLIPSFAELVSPLIKITTPKNKFNWNEEQTIAFETLQKIFFHEPMLHLPDWNKEFLLNTDASKVAISAVLLQKEGDQMLPISYFSKTLSPAEMKYPAIKLELYAIYKGITAFKYYLFNRHFVILSDAKPLKNYKKSTSPADVTTRWLLEISEYSFTFDHIPGSKNILADYLSRCNPEPITQDIASHPEILHSQEALPVIDTLTDLSNANTVQITNHITSDKQTQEDCQSQNSFDGSISNTQDPLLEISDESIYLEQRKDPNLLNIIEALENHNLSAKTKSYYLNPNNNILCFDKMLSLNQVPLHRAVLPTSLIVKALTIAHISHTGINKTLKNVQKRFTWKNMISDTINFVQSCQVCMEYKHHRIKKAPLLAAPVPTAPNQKVSMDILGPVTSNFYILTVIDHFSRHLELYNLNHITAAAVTKCFLNYVATHGRPDIVLTDKGKQFTSVFFKTFNKVLSIKVDHIAVKNPQANGISERINSQIKKAIKAMASQGYDLVTAMKIHQSVYNATNHPATKFSPNLLHFGREINDIYQHYRSNSNWKILDTTYDIYKLIEVLDKIYYDAYTNNEISRQKVYQKSHQERKFLPIQVNELVYVKFPSFFEKRVQGPFKVEKIISPVLVQVKSRQNERASPMLIHTNRIIKYHPRQEKLMDCQDNPSSNPAVQRNSNKGNIPEVTSSYNLRNRVIGNK